MASVTEVKTVTGATLTLDLEELALIKRSLEIRLDSYSLSYEDHEAIDALLTQIKKVAS